MSLELNDKLCTCGHKQDEHINDGDCKLCEECGEYVTFADVMALVGRMAHEDGLELQILGEVGNESYRLNMPGVPGYFRTFSFEEILQAARAGKGRR